MRLVWESDISKSYTLEGHCCLWSKIEINQFSKVLGADQERENSQQALIAPSVRWY